MSDIPQKLIDEIYKLSYEGFTEEYIADELEIPIELVYDVIEKEGVYKTDETSSLKSVIKQLQQQVQNLQNSLSNKDRETLQLRQQIQILQEIVAKMSDNNQPVQTVEAIQKWEYKRGCFSDDELNKLGEEGWEAFGYNDNMVTVLKRPKQQQKVPQRNDYYDYGR